MLPAALAGGACLTSAAYSGDTRLVRGEPGVGKSVLLDAAADMAHAAEMRVLRASGSEFEADVSYSALNQLLLPLRNDLPRLPPGTRDALSVALGFGPGPPPGALLVCNAALSLVMAVADQTPMLLLVDDVQWVDRASAVVLGFIARRVEGHPIGLVMSCRTGSESFLNRRGLTDVTVQPLDRDASEHLVDAHFPDLPPRTRQRLLDLAQGNPLAPCSARGRGWGGLGTIGAHLYRIFPKLAITSRAGLRVAPTTHPNLNQPTHEPPTTQAQ